MDWLLSFFSGLLLALVVAVPARLLKLDQKRFFAPALLIIVSALYVGFALFGGDSQVVMKEASAAFLFLLLAIVGGAFYVPIAIFGLFLHGVFDVFHDAFVVNPVAPSWWPALCAGFDIAIALWVWWLWKRGKARIVAPKNEPEY